MISLELLSAEEVKALSAALNIAVKQLGICTETVHIVDIHRRLEGIVKAFNEQKLAQDAAPSERPN